jgi:alkylation response protein AidB-like acyl-CoA dehydrogenase
MEFALTAEQRFIQSSAAEFLQARADAARRRAVLAGDEGWDSALWAAMGGEMGWAGLMVPEAYGGAGLSAVEMALILEQTGRVLAVAPFFETAVVAVQAVLCGGSQAQREALLPGLAAGGVRAAFVFVGNDGVLPPEGAAGILRAEGDEWRLSGGAPFVPFAHVADVLVVVARIQGGGLVLLAVPAGTVGMTVTRLAALDATRPAAGVRFDDVAVNEDMILGVPGGGDGAVRRVMAVACALLASEQMGAAAYCLESTVEYAKTRVQFGRPIGSFQAVKHDLADMMLRVEAARSAAYYAAAAIAEDGAEVEEAACVARAVCTEAFSACAGEAIQLHGGIGFTWEHAAHLYFKRARATASWFGGAAYHYERLAGLIGLDPLVEEAAA